MNAHCIASDTLLLQIPNQLVQYHLSNSIYPNDDHIEEKGVLDKPENANAVGSSGEETDVTTDRTKDYGKYILDFMADFDSDDEYVTQAGW